ncbi:LOW QUALITY PROTEIN: RNA binding motif protein 12Bb [Boleophthalmus pectinirostris]|uniref:LOW QUALITY PROTEIN: RNA binding motif protein 12Bb n=1 Tax=Boleophthalmus pectinirostris TaxID=150288 RepID=UPI00242C2775|nr:LOW QUALITY PROTEIN: RNA binding motif protein 12Bb [Boleophthalmus pectinirostris]
MAVVIRLQGLSIAAGSQDIRKFFSGLRIPDGGVHIVGGELDEAFIIFGSDEDARIAMTKSGDYIKDSPVKLLLSSKTEMQNVLERSSVNMVMDQRKMLDEKPRRMKMEEKRGLRHSTDRGRPSGRLGYSPTQHRRTSGFEKDRQLMLRGMPFSATEKDVLKFFDGLAVEKVVLVQNNRGQNNGNGLVTFASKEDANHGLKRHKQYIGTRFVEIYTLKEWQQVFGDTIGVAPSGMSERQQQSQPRSQEASQYHGRSRSPPLVRSSSPSSGEYCVLLDNMSYAAEKHDIMKFFSRARLGSDQILYLLDGSGSRTRRAFVLFRSLQDYRDALDRDNRTMVNRNISVRPISREKMISLLEDQKLDSSSDRNSIHIRSLPFDVRKVEVMDFLIGFNVAEDDVILLRDHKGNGLGEVIVSFQTEEEAIEALSLNGRRFLGSEVRLRGVSQSEVQDLIKPKVSSREDRYPERKFEASFVQETDFVPKRPLREERSRVSRDLTRGSHSEGRESARGGTKLSGHDGPTCIKLINLPFNIKVEEVYDFCYGYSIIPGSVSLQYDKNGASKGTATVVFESRQEALAAIDDLTGRPIGQRKIQLVFL